MSQANQHKTDKSLAESLDLTADTMKRLVGLFPEALSEGRLDVAALKRTLGAET